MPNTQLTKEIWVTTKNEVGGLNKMVTGLAEAKVNIWGLCAWEESGNFKTMMLTDNNNKALELLNGAGYKTEVHDVVVTNLEDKPGTVWDATGKIKNAGIDIKYCYVTTCGECPKTRWVLSTDNNQKAVQVLG